MSWHWLTVLRAASVVGGEVNLRLHVCEIPHGVTARIFQHMTHPDEDSTNKAESAASSGWSVKLSLARTQVSPRFGASPAGSHLPRWEA